MDWEVFIFTFIVYQLGYWICYFTQVKKNKINLKRKRWKNTTMDMKYTQKTRNGLINNHKYVVKIYPPKHGIYVYTIQFLYDSTAQVEMDLIMNYASMISIKHNFDFDEKDLELEE